MEGLAATLAEGLLAGLIVQGAQRPPRLTDRLGRQTLRPREGQQQGLVGGEMIENRQMESRIANERAKVAGIKPGQVQEARDALFVGGEKSQPAQRQIIGFDGRFALPGAR